MPQTKQMNPAVKKISGVFAAVLALILLFAYIKSQGRVIDKTDTIKGIISPVLAEFSITDKNLVRESTEERSLGRKRYIFVFRQYKIPNDIQLKGVGKALEKCLEKTHFRVKNSDYYFTKGEETARFDISFAKFDIFSLRLDKAGPKKVSRVKKRFPNPKVAIVLDDFGYNRKNINAFFEIDIPISFSILPNQRYSSTIAQEANEKGYEVILHLPLEPLEGRIPLEPGTITTKMTEDEVLAALDTAIKSVPHLQGVSNHMGSKAMQDERVITVIFKALLDKKLFFLDSLVTNRSVGEDVAGRISLPFAERSVFLDNKLDAGYIRGQLYELRDLAFKRGKAIGVGHDRAKTAEVLGEVLPELEKDGIQFVRVSDLAR